jgi:hypothetical protein
MAEPAPSPSYDEKTLSKQFVEGRTRFQQGDPVQLLDGLTGLYQMPPPRSSTAAAPPRSAPVSPDGGGEAGGRDNLPSAGGPAGPPASSTNTVTSLGQRVLEAFHSAGTDPGGRLNIGPFTMPVKTAEEAGTKLEDIAKSIYDAGPGTIKDVLTGKLDPFSEEGQAAARKTALLISTPPVGKAPEGALTMGAASREGEEGVEAAAAKGAGEAAAVSKPAEGTPPPPSAGEAPKPGAAPPAAPAGAAPPAKTPPPFTIAGEEPPATGAPKPTPETISKATRYLNNQTEENPIQNSLRAMSNDATAQQTIEDIAKFVDRDKVKPDDVTAMNAYSLQTDPFTIARTVNAKLEGMDDHMAAFNIAINSAAEEVMNFAKRAKETGDPEDYTRALDAVAHQIQFEQAWTDSGTAMGRAFRTRQLPFDARTDYRQVFQDVINQVGSSDAQKIVDHIAAIDDPKKVAPFISALKWMKSRDGLMYGWYNTMLSNYRVIQKKLLSDTTMLTWNLAVHKAAETFGSGAVAPGETLAMLQGYYHSLGDAVKTAGRALRTGQVQFDPVNQTLEGQTYSRPWVYANGQKAWGETPLTEKTIEVLRAALPTSLMGAVDDFYKTINYRGELAALARREATQQIEQEVARIGRPETAVERGARVRAVAGANALTPEEIGTAEITGQTAPEIMARRPAAATLPVALTHADQIQQRMQEILNNVPPHLHEEALANADRNLFVEPLSTIGQSISNIADKLVIPIPYATKMGDIGHLEIPLGRMILPFTKRPFNIIREAARNSPIAPLMPSYQAAIRQGGAAADLARARAGLGTFVAMTIGTLAATRLLTGRGPSSPNANRAWQDAGNSPYQLYGFNYRNAEPWATMAAPIADSFDAIRFAKDDATTGMIVDSLVAGVGNSLLDASPLMGLQQFLDGLNAEGPRDEKWFNSLAMSVDPAGLKAWKANVDQWQRAHDGLLENFWANTPYKSFEEPLEHDAWGDPIPAKAGFFPFWTGKPGEVPPGYDFNSGKPTPAKEWIWDNRRAFPNNENDGGRVGLEKVPRVVTESVGGLQARYQLSPEQRERYQKLAGNEVSDPNSASHQHTFKDTINELVLGVHPDQELQGIWNKGAPEDQARMILTLQNDYRKMAFRQLKTEYPEISEAMQAQIMAKHDTIQQHRATAQSMGDNSAPPLAATASTRVQAPTMGVTR